MGSTIEDNNPLTSRSASNQNLRQLEPPVSSSMFSDMVSRLVMGRNHNKVSPDNLVPPSDFAKKPENNISINRSNQETASEQKSSNSPQTPTQNTPSLQLPPRVKLRSCRAPATRKFGQPCSCGQSYNHYKIFTSSNSTGFMPPAAYSPMHLYDPHTKKCLPTTREHDMLLKECHSMGVSAFYPKPDPKPQYNSPCVYDDLVCDTHRYRCACKPPLHLFYGSNTSTFGCVPIGPTSSPDGRVNCRAGYVYNVISNECQKIFDINELPPNYTTGVSATQFSFVTIVLIWILLLILIVTAKLRKLRTSSLYRNSPSNERRLHHGNGYRNQNQNTSAWLHPFIAAVNGHHHLNQHRTTVERHSDEPGNYNDTDFFLSNGNLRINGLLSENNFVGSQHSLNNPPPKFEEIYPSCPPGEHTAEHNQPPSNEDLPSYDEAMKLQTKAPPDPKV